MCKSRATHSGARHVQHVVCHVVRKGSSAIKFYRVEIEFILVLVCWMKPLTDEGGEETEVSRKKLLTTSLNENSSPKPRLEPVL